MQVSQVYRDLWGSVHRIKRGAQPKNFSGP